MTLETLVAPRIRRTLLEYLAVHPTDRFYLRGLAKQLALPVSPLRRELKRLEQSGMLATSAEGNLLFYSVNRASAGFVQLQRAGTPPDAAQVLPVAQGSVLRAEPATLNPQLHIGTISHQSLRRARWIASPTPALLAITAIGVTVLLALAGGSYRMLVAHTPSTPSSPRVITQQVGVAAGETASGAMRGSRWQVVPGGVGGFSAGTGK